MSDNYLTLPGKEISDRQFIPTHRIISNFSRLGRNSTTINLNKTKNHRYCKCVFEKHICNIDSLLTHTFQVEQKLQVIYWERSICRVTERFLNEHWRGCKLGTYNSIKMNRSLFINIWIEMRMWVWPTFVYGRPILTTHHKCISLIESTFENTDVSLKNRMY